MHRAMRAWLLVIVLVVAALLPFNVPQPILGQSDGYPAGSPDPSFGSNGKVTTAIGSGNDKARGVAVQPDGKIVVVGYSNNGTNNDFAVARYTSAGVLDTTFSTDGKVTTAIGSGDDKARAVAVQPDGKILVAGYSDNGSNDDFAVARYTSTGVLDTTFSTDGKVTTNIGTNLEDEAFAVAVMSDGKIIVAGKTKSTTATLLALVRYTPAGVVDTGFGTSGKVASQICGTAYQVGHGMAVQSDDKIVVAGPCNTSTSDKDFFVARFAKGGGLDRTFGKDRTGTTITAGAKTGVNTAAFNTTSDVANAVVLQPDGKIVVAGVAGSGSSANFAVARFTSAGILDTAFSTDGKVTTDFGSTSDTAYGVAVDSDGRIVVAGVAGSGAGANFAVARFTSAGALDTAFSTDGKVTTDFGSTSDTAYGVAVDSESNAVVAGVAGANFAVARYLGQRRASDAALNAIVVGYSVDGSSFGGDLGKSPRFGADTRSYWVTVDNGVTHVKLTPTASDSNAVVKVGVRGGTPATVSSGSESAAIALPVGRTAIDVVVTAEDNFTMRTYTVTVTRRQIPAKDTELSALSGTTSVDGSSFDGKLVLSPAFAAGTVSYTATVPSRVTHVKLTPTVQASGARPRVGVQGGTLAAVASGSASAAVAVAVGDTAIDVEVTSRDGTLTRTYTVTVTRLTDTSSLTALSARAVRGRSVPPSVSNLGLSPAFKTSVTSYTATVGKNITHIRLTATTANANATIIARRFAPHEVRASMQSGSESSGLRLEDVGNTVWEVVVTGPNGDTSVYKVTARRPGSPTTPTTSPPSTTATTSPPSTTATTSPPSTTATTSPPSTTATTSPPSTTATTSPPSTTATTSPPSTTATTSPPSTTPTTTPQSTTPTTTPQSTTPTTTPQSTTPTTTPQSTTTTTTPSGGQTGGGPAGGGGEAPVEQTPAGEFSDLDQAGVHTAAIEDLAAKGVLAGTGCRNGLLCPGEPIKRWEMAVWLVRVIDSEDPGQPTRSRFEDVTAGLWWAGHVERLAQLRITIGCSTEPLEYCPDEPVTRGQMASFLARAFDLAAGPPSGFEDTSGNTHEARIDALYAARITLGCKTDPLQFCPLQPTTRAQMASFVTRAMEARQSG